MAKPNLQDPQVQKAALLCVEAQWRELDDEELALVRKFGSALVQPLRGAEEFADFRANYPRVNHERHRAYIAVKMAS